MSNNNFIIIYTIIIEDYATDIVIIYDLYS